MLILRKTETIFKMMIKNKMMMMMITVVCYLKETGKAINSSRHKNKYHSRFVGHS